MLRFWQQIRSRAGEFTAPLYVEGVANPRHQSRIGAGGATAQAIQILVEID
jgi:hypothetical protein